MRPSYTNTFLVVVRASGVQVALVAQNMWAARGHRHIESVEYTNLTLAARLGGARAHGGISLSPLLRARVRGVLS